MNDLRMEIRKSLQAKSDAKYRQSILTLVPSDAEILGVRVPEIRTLVKEFRKRHGDLDFETVCTLVESQFADRCREEALFGVFLLASFKRQLSSALWPRIDRMIDAIENWETCDQLATGVAAAILAKDQRLLSEVTVWAQAKNPWRRRFAAALTTALNQHGQSFVAGTLQVCDRLLAEREPVVQKAVGWALREACKHDEPAVFEFLFANKKRAQPKILREAATKLTAEHRQALLSK